MKSNKILIGIASAILIGVVLVLGLKLTRKNNTSDTANYLFKIDSLNTELTNYKNLLDYCTAVADSLIIDNYAKECRLDTLQAFADSINAENFRYQYKLGRIKSYIEIVNKNSTQSKYLKGWITRALNE